MCYKHIGLQCQFMAGEPLPEAGIACVQKLAEQDRVYRQRAKPPATKPPPSASLPLVSIPRSRYVQCPVRAHGHTGIPILARTEAPREVFCMNSVLGVRPTGSAANNE